MIDIGVKGALDASHEHSASFLLALGRVVAESAVAETLITTVLHRYIGADHGTIITAELDFRKKLNLLLSLVRAAPAKGLVVRPSPGVIARMEKSASEFNRLYDERNDYVHGSWLAGEAPRKRRLVRSSAKGNYKEKIVEIDSSQIDGLADRLNAASSRLAKLLLEQVIPASLIASTALQI